MLARRVSSLLKPVNIQSTLPTLNVLSTRSFAENVKDFYTESKHYQSFWGHRFHIGYYPQVADPTADALDWDAAGEELNWQMCDAAGIDANSRVIDFGCGLGRNVIDIAEVRNCERVVGLDLTPDFIEESDRNLLKESKKIQKKCAFYCGSVLDIPDDVMNEAPFTHVFAQEAICHVAGDLDTFCQQLHRILDTGGVFVNIDFMCGNHLNPNPIIRKHFMNRLQFSHLNSPSEYVEILTRNGFAITDYRDWSDHAVYGYKEMQQKYKDAGLNPIQQGIPLTEHYTHTYTGFANRDLVMPMIVAKKL